MAQDALGFIEARPMKNMDHMLRLAKGLPLRMCAVGVCCGRNLTAYFRSCVFVTILVILDLNIRQQKSRTQFHTLLVFLTHMFCNYSSKGKKVYSCISTNFVKLVNDFLVHLSSFSFDLVFSSSVWLNDVK